MALTGLQTAQASRSGEAQQGPAGSAALIKETDLRGYIAELDHVSTAVSGLAENPSQIAPLRDSLPKMWLVRAEGQTFSVSTEWLVSTLATMDSTPKLRASLEKDLLARLAIFREEAAGFEKPSAEPDAAVARARVTEILKRREFESVSPPGWFQKLGQRVASWILRTLRRILRPILAIPHSSEVLIWGVVAILFLLLALLVARVLLRTARTANLSLDSPIPPGKTWRDWAREALEAAARRDYRDAVHRGYWAGVFRLWDLGALQLEGDRTPREYLRILAESHAERSEPGPASDRSLANLLEQRTALATLTRRLEVTWYGYQVTTHEDFRATIENLEVLGCRFPSILPTAES
jgi:hypothetical protein